MYQSSGFKKSKTMDELIQTYFDKLYTPFKAEITKTQTCDSDQTYGELYYYSVVKLLKYLTLKEKDHFLDIGSGLGKIVAQTFLTTKVASSTGIEINEERHTIANSAKETLMQHLPDLFMNRKSLNIILGDFLKAEFHNITVIYTSSIVFSFPLLQAMGEKINNMKSVQKVASLRKLPNLDNFQLTDKIFLHGNWDYVACHIYTRVN